MEPMKNRQFVAGQVLFTAGTVADEAYLIRSGKVEIYDVVGGQRKVYATRGPGEIFGEIALLDGQRRSASAKALVDTDVIVVTQPLLKAELSKTPALVQRLITAYLKVIRTANAR